MKVIVGFLVSMVLAASAQASMHELVSSVTANEGDGSYQALQKNDDGSKTVIKIISTSLAVESALGAAVKSQADLALQGSFLPDGTTIIVIAVTTAKTVADPTLQKFAQAAVRCVKAYGYAPPKAQLSVIEFNTSSLRIEYSNRGGAETGFVANMDIKNGQLFLYDVVNDRDLPCAK